VNGECLFDVEDSSTHHERDIRHKRLHFGLVFQNFNLFPQYTALRNVTLACELLATEDPDYRTKRSRIISDINSRARNLLDQVGLSDKLDSYPPPALRRSAATCRHSQSSGYEP
jgi:polar amino acid transport system ATP-binding protein